MSDVGPNGYRLCKRGHERTPGNVAPNRGCKLCKSIAAAEAYVMSDAIRNRNTEYRKSNPEKERTRGARYRQENIGKERARSNNYYIRNTEKERVRKAEYLKRNLAGFRLRCQKRRALKKNSGGTLSKDITEKLIVLQKGKCRICKTSIKAQYELDHIVPLAKGGLNIDSNIQLLCRRCNRKKGAKDPHIHAQHLGMLFL